MAKQAGRLNNLVVSELFATYERDLFYFLLGILRNDSQASDAVQTTLTKLIEQGGEVDPNSLKSWLFRVAFNVAMEMRRRRKTELRHQEKLGLWKNAMKSANPDWVSEFEDREIGERLQNALSMLPPDQRQVVEKRIKNELKFSQIAEELRVPLGTVLTRMRAAVGKLRRIMCDETETIDE